MKNLNGESQQIMGKKRFDHRLMACVEKGKCVPGVEMPVINPADNIVEGRIDARRKPRKSLMEKGRVVEQAKISDERIIELFENKMKQMRRGSLAQGGNGENSVDMALKMLRDKAKLREINKLGAELEDIKDRMVDVRMPISCFHLFNCFIHRGKNKPNALHKFLASRGGASGGLEGDRPLQSLSSEPRFSVRRSNFGRLVGQIPLSELLAPPPPNRLILAPPLLARDTK